MATYLEEIVAHHRDRASLDTRRLATVMRAAERVPDPPPLLDALVRTGAEPIRLIAEVKRKSPSAGVLAADVDPARQAASYELGGAAAISVLTDGPHFGGSPADLHAVRELVDLPVLRKDFTVCGLDVADARLMGASGVLLIVAALSRAELRSFLELTDALGLTALVEVHDEQELTAALDAGALVVGVNQRDLETFEIDPHRAESLSSHFPSDVIAVAESGLTDPEAVQRCTAVGYDAVLVGEALMRSGDPVATTAAFCAPAPSNEAEHVVAATDAPVSDTPVTEPAP